MSNYTGLITFLVIIIGIVLVACLVPTLAIKNNWKNDFTTETFSGNGMIKIGVSPNSVPQRLLPFNLIKSDGAAEYISDCTRKEKIILSSIPTTVYPSVNTKDCVFIQV